MPQPPNQRPIEQGVITDLGERLSYSGYLQLDTLLAAQHPLSQPVHHDELLFIIQHQVAELWMKLVIHELRAAIEHLKADRLEPTQKILARVKQVQRQLFEQWGVLETLTPNEYLQFRHLLGPASGFQSLQYRLMEFLLGNKNADMVAVFAHDPAAQAELLQTLQAPSLYDEFLRYLHRHGHDIPGDRVERDWTLPHARDDRLIPAFQRIYENIGANWEAYALCEQLLDIEQSFQLWRFRHMKTVERIIGFRRGTGGSSGVGFLKQALELTFFPELLDVRTVLGAGVDAALQQ